MIPTSWHDAGRDGKRAFYSAGTQTIRMYPENYCLAVRDSAGFHTYRDEHATRAIWVQLDTTIAAHKDAGKAAAVEAIDKMLKADRAVTP